MEELAAILLLDLHGYSSLDPCDQESVFNEFLPAIDNLVKEYSKKDIIDANTWGDSVLIIFKSTGIAVKVALEIKRLLINNVWNNKKLQDLEVRIALHAGDINRGTDPIRLHASEGSHVYGAEMVLPARIEPIVPSNNIYVTEAALPHIISARTKGVHIRKDARIENMGLVSLAKGHLPVKLSWLGGKDEIPPSPVEKSFDINIFKTETLLRLNCLRGINEYVEQFHVWLQSSPDPNLIDEGFKLFHKKILHCLQLVDAEKHKFEADVLIMDVTDKTEREYSLKMWFPSTCEDHTTLLPEMKLQRDTMNGTFLSPKDHEGVATYVLWASFKKVGDIAVTKNVPTSHDTFLYKRQKHDSVGGGGTYTLIEQRPMYRKSKGSINPPYKSILSIPLPIMREASHDPEDEYSYETIGVLNITSNKANAFEIYDFAWAEAAASLIGSLYQSYSSYLIKKGEKK